MAAELGAAPFDPLLTRRNVVLRGAHLAPLIGGDFALESRGHEVRLKAGRPANPCAWMDQMLAPGAHKAMRGRGGVRCQPLTDGILHRGPAVLISPVPLDPAAPARLDVTGVKAALAGPGSGSDVLIYQYRVPVRVHHDEASRPG